MFSTMPPATMRDRVPRSRTTSTFSGTRTDRLVTMATVMASSPAPYSSTRGRNTRRSICARLQPWARALCVLSRTRPRA